MKKKFENLTRYSVLGLLIHIYFTMLISLYNFKQDPSLVNELVRIMRANPEISFRINNFTGYERFGYPYGSVSLYVNMGSYYTTFYGNDIFSFQQRDEHSIRIDFSDVIEIAGIIQEIDPEQLKYFFNERIIELNEIFSNLNPEIKVTVIQLRYTNSEVAILPNGISISIEHNEEVYHITLTDPASGEISIRDKFFNEITVPSELEREFTELAVSINNHSFIANELEEFNEYTHSLLENIPYSEENTEIAMR